MKILALDLSTRTGHACGRDRGAVTSGVWKLGGMKQHGVGHCCSALAAALGDAIHREAPDLVIYESPLIPERQTRGDVARLLYGLCAVVEMVCLECGMPREACEEATADEARKLVLGRVMRGSSGWIKDAVTAWAMSQGYSPYDDNEADALLLLRYRQILGRGRVMAGAGSVG